MRLTIDGKTVEFEGGRTILEVARANGIDIPTLCAHKSLTPFGACRMCIVEVEGLRNLPTSCTTPAADGMVIKTDTPQVKNARLAVLQLILSKHPSGCLICDEGSSCNESMCTTRKVSITTGCRTCPKDEMCELQDIVRKMGVDDLAYPIWYRNLRIEREDPFYDRDYNLCILCGRCVQVCQEVRLASTLSFVKRGYDTLIGPAYGRNHIEGGCEFCGACVTLCPVGALSEKVRKWAGVPDGTVQTTCALCGIGCQLALEIKDGEVIGSMPVEDDLVSDGQLCVKGRFSVAEVVNDYNRLRKPYRPAEGFTLDISWDEALELAAEKIGACKPDEFGLLISPNCTNEELYIAQKFARQALGSDQVDTTARLYYGAGFNAYLNLLKLGIPFSEIKNASAILCVGLDTRYGRSVVGVELKKAMRKGVEVVTLHPNQHNLALYADHWLKPENGKELDMLRRLAALTGRDLDKLKGNDPLTQTAKKLLEGKSPLILLGSEFVQSAKSAQIFEAIEQLARNSGAGVLAFPAQNNLYGSLLMGAYPELLPGAKASGKQSAWTAASLFGGKKLRVLYLVGEVPLEERPPADFVIYQHLYQPPANYKADLVLPAAAFTEVDGTFTSGEGRTQRVRKAVAAPGEALPHWDVLCRIARRLGTKGFDFNDVSRIHAEIAGLVSGFDDFENGKRQASALDLDVELQVNVPKKNDRAPFIKRFVDAEHSYLGFPLSTWVGGLEELFAAAESEAAE